MKKRNLIFPLVVSSLFMPSIEALESRTEFNSLENENNIFEAVDILIAEGGGCGGGAGGGGGMNPIKRKEANIEKALKSLRYFQSKKAEAEARGESTENIDKKIKKYIKKIQKLDTESALDVQIIEGDENTMPKNLIYYKYKNLNKNQLNAIEQKTNSMMEEIWEPYKRIAEENKRRKESGEYTTEDGLYVELMGLSPRSLNFTSAALDSQEDGNEARAETYHKLAVKSLESSLNKNEVDSSVEHHHHGLLAINYYYLDDLENSNKSFKKAAPGYKKTKEGDLTKTLIATTSILSGNVNQGCQDLFDYFADGDIPFDSTFPIEDFCIFDEE